MSVHHLSPTNDARHLGIGLLDAPHQWRDTDWTATSECHVPERHAIDSNRATIERAKGALMLRYDMDKLQALSPVHTLARTLVQGSALGCR